MTEKQTFIQADEALNKVINQIKDSQWDMAMPESFTTNTAGLTIKTLRDVINYHAYDEAWVPDMMAGKTMAEVGGDTFDGDLLGNTPKEAYEKYSQQAITAVNNLDDLERTVHYTYGDYPAQEALWHAILFRAMRAHDLAKVIGVNSDLPEELVKAVWDIVVPHAEEWRALGVFPPAVEVPEGAPLQDRLLGLTGRKP